MKNEKPPNKETREDLMRGFDLGDGINISMGVGDDISYFFTNMMPAPEGLPNNIEVEVSSSQNDNLELLHHLLNQTRRLK